MADSIKQITIQGFKSIRELNGLSLRSLNVLIGANGAGKSNFVSFFQLLRELIERRLQFTIRIEGGADASLFLGPKITRFLTARVVFQNHLYEFVLEPASDNQFVFGYETIVAKEEVGAAEVFFGPGNLESRLKNVGETGSSNPKAEAAARYLHSAISNFVAYHFHDTTATAGVRREQSVNDNETLRPDGSNLAAFLYGLRQTHPQSYGLIRDAVQLAAPFFEDFKLRPVLAGPDRIKLEWLQKNSDFPFQANQLSDGTLRFMCLATALLQPVKPQTMLFDEPELGLHPYALTLLGNLFRQATGQGECQIIISTQSAQLLNEFEPEDVIIVERRNGESTFQRLDSAHLSQWLDDYTLGELWQKNLLGGRPTEDVDTAIAAELRLQNT